MADPNAPSAAALSLRESFGDRKLPDITRKITACVACRKRKVKCHMTDAEPPCTRCKSRGLSCTVNKSIQMLLENDLTWKETIEQRINELENTMATVAGDQENSGVANRRNERSTSLQDEMRTFEKDQSGRIGSQEFSTQIQDRNVSLNLFCSLGAFPAASIETIDSTIPKASTNFAPDFISNGIIDLSVAQAHFDYFDRKLNPSLYDILHKGSTLAEIRSTSPFLCLAVCTTAAYCAGSRDYQALLDAFKSDVASKLFSRSRSFDDVRALCISAFWLNEISTTLVALAVRMSSEHNLHRCITKVPFTKQECYERTRLYLIVYICDHHCALRHGRPPMTRELTSKENLRIFLQSQYSEPIDLPLISQVELWSINSMIFDVYGADIENSSIWSNSAEIDNFSNAYDRWYNEWNQVLSLRLGGQMYPDVLTNLYLHSAKLYLFSHIFRGSAQRSQQPPVNAHGFDKFAQEAVQNALSIIQFATNEKEGRSCLALLPCYLTTTILYACIFVLRTSSQPNYNPDKEGSLLALRRLSDMLQSLTSETQPSNPLFKLANSLLLVTGGQTESSLAQTSDNSQILDVMPDIDYQDGMFDMVFLGDDEHWLLSHTDFDPTVATF